MKATIAKNILQVVVLAAFQSSILFTCIKIFEMRFMYAATLAMTATVMFAYIFASPANE